MKQLTITAIVSLLILNLNANELERFDALRQAVVRNYRKALSSGSSETGRNYRKLLSELSKTEYRRYKTTAKKYLAKGYELNHAKTTAIKMIHGYALASQIKITSSELERIMARIDVDKIQEEVTPYSFINDPDAKITRM